MTTSATPPRRAARLHRRIAATVAALTLSTVALTGCAADSSTTAADTAAGGTVWDSSSVHEVSIEIEESALNDALTAYAETGEKEWVTADVTIDGQTISDAGMRLKGNSSLRGTTTDADAADLPWLIDLDQFVDGQDLDGWEAFVIRSNNTATSLNEAVALDLLQEAGLASEDAVATRFTVNGGDASLRLMIQDLDNTWDETNFASDGVLYKSEATGDWTYRGDDPDAYEDVFDVEAGEDDYAPLTEFLRWLEQSSDEEFAEGLADRLDVDAFATYLAFEDLIGNFDDIDGPGNNSFLRWDADAAQMTVVAWDHNLAFGVTNGGPGEMGAPGGEGGLGGPPPAGDLARPDEGGPAGSAGEAGGRQGSNVLAERFLADPGFAALYDEALTELQATLLESGAAQEVLDAWTTVLEEQASDLVDATAIESDAAQVASYFDEEAATGSFRDG